MSDEARRRLLADLDLLPPDLIEDVARFASALAIVHGRRVADGAAPRGAVVVTPRRLAYLLLVAGALVLLGVYILSFVH